MQKIIVTSRSQHWGRIGTINLSVFNETEAMTLVKNSLENTTDLTKSTK